MACRQARKRDGHSSRTPVTRRLQQPTRTAVLDTDLTRWRLPAKARAVPIRSCSRWGLPCRRRCRRRGALLPHLFTLTAATRCGGMFSVALSLGSRPPDVIRHRLSMEPGLSSPAIPDPARLAGEGRVRAGAAVRPTDQNRDGGARTRRQEAKRAKSRARAAIERTRPRCASKSFSVARVDSSAIPSTRAGRKWR